MFQRKLKNVAMHENTVSTIVKEGTNEAEFTLSFDKKEMLIRGRAWWRQHRFLRRNRNMSHKKDAL